MTTPVDKYGRGSWRRMVFRALSVAVFVAAFDALLSVFGAEPPVSLPVGAAAFAILAATVLVVSLLAFGVVRVAGVPAPSAARAGSAFTAVLGLAGVLAIHVEWDSVTVAVVAGVIVTVAALVSARTAAERADTSSPLLASPRLARGAVALFVLLPGTLALLAWSEAGSSASGAENGRFRGEVRDILLVTIDTLRRDHVSCYPNAHVRTPHLEQLCEKAIIYDGAVAPASWTLPSMTSILTGLEPLVHGVDSVGDGIGSEVPTMPAALEAAGYRTKAVVRNAYLGPKSGLARGFGDFEWYRGGSPGRGAGIFLGRRLLPTVFVSSLSTDDLTDRALAWLRETEGQPRFLWLHYFDPHLPYAPPEEAFASVEPPRAVGRSFDRLRDVRGGYFAPTPDEREWVRRLYAEEVAHVDRSVGRILEELRRSGTLDDALVVVASDHGEELWEHGGFEHGHSLVDEVIRVPLIVKPPGATARTDVAALTSTSRVAPTILDVAGIGKAEGSLLDLAEGGVAEKPISITSRLYYEDREAVLFRHDGRVFKYEIQPATGIESVREAFEGRDREIDAPAEVLETGRQLHALAATRAERERERRGIRDHHAEELDAGVERELRSLGYLN